MVTISPWSFSFSARTMKTNQTLTVVGTNAHRVDAIEKVSGKAIYTSDIQLPGMAHARILRSPVAHARLVKVDASKAKEFPGVIATLTRDDIQGFNLNMARPIRINRSLPSTRYATSAIRWPRCWPTRRTSRSKLWN